MTTIASNISSLLSQAGDATLVAVSKGRGVNEIRQALLAGQRIFGENRVQEASDKFSLLKSAYPDITLHLIGPLQTNKVKKALELFDVIETLDRPALADALAKAMTKTRRKPLFYIEVNIGNEAQKSGVKEEGLKEFLAYCRDICGLTISGLMCIPPVGQDPRPYFARMRTLTTDLALEHLSMGMSSDYTVALSHGSTEIRIGNALFGKATI